MLLICPSFRPHVLNVPCHPPYRSHHPCFETPAPCRTRLCTRSSCHALYTVFLASFVDISVQRWRVPYDGMHLTKLERHFIMKSNGTSSVLPLYKSHYARPSYFMCRYDGNWTPRDRAGQRAVEITVGKIPIQWMRELTCPSQRDPFQRSFRLIP